MHDEVDRRVVRGLHAEADAFTATVTADQIEERIAHSTGSPWLLPAVAILGSAALIIALGIGTGRDLLIGDSSQAPSTAAEDPQLWPEWALPSPYDWGGVAEALRPRGLILERPGASQVRQERRTIGDLLAGMEEHLADQPAAEIVGIHLALVTTSEDAQTRGQVLERVLAYVVETTGYNTGNCFDLRSAMTGDDLVGACFYANRSRPLPPATELPVGTWISRSPFRDGTICVGIEVEQSLAERHRAWWWHPGGSGDCRSRSSSLIEAVATTDEVPLVRIEIPTIPRGSETLSLRFTGYTDDGFTLDSVPFLAVDGVDPVERP